MDMLYNETSERLCLMNRFIGRVKGQLNFPFLRTDAEIVAELKNIVSETEKEYEELWNLQRKTAMQTIQEQLNNQ